MIRCSRCVLPATRPDTAFIGGVCSACISHEKRPEIDWKARRAELEALLARHGGRCIVPSSGGKDSTWQALTLREMGADVTLITATTCMLTDVGRKNIDNLARYCRTIEVTPNREVRAKLNRLGLEMVGDISWPEHASIFSTPFRMAVALAIPLMFYGECPQSFWGGPIGTDDARVMTRRWTAEFGGYLGLRPSDFVGEHGITEVDMRDYLMPSDEEMERVGVEAHFLGQYLGWDSARNAEAALQHGFTAELPYPGNWFCAENLDNGMTGAHDFFSWLKYGFGRLAAQISVDIRAGRITRDEALAIVRERDGLFPVKYMNVPLARVLQRIGMSSDRFMEICNDFMAHELFEQDRIKWGQHLTLKEFA